MGLASASMGIWGWWAFDIFTLMASYLAVQVVAAQTIMRSLGLLTFMIPVGVSSAAGLKVGHFIGKGNKAGIKYYFNICVWTSIGLGLL